MNVLLRFAEVRKLAESGDARRIRVRSHLSIPQVAAAVRVAPVTVSRWERGCRKPTGDAALRWLQLLRALGTKR